MKTLYLSIILMLAATFSLHAYVIDKPVTPSNASFQSYESTREPFSTVDSPYGGPQNSGDDGWLDLGDDDPLKMVPVSDGLWIIIPLLLVYLIIIRGAKRTSRFIRQ
ncbi:MAG: hypothetical protein LBI82_07825 [Dysgonamonadaceae bacterium]|jgi:hypothetical protein|nr:hypothetical protein [Dysgonamonadaceae bacterium]